jgi:hypothetical protein
VGRLCFLSLLLGAAFAAGATGYARAGNFPTSFVPGDFPTNHFDDNRTGWNPDETILTTSNVNSNSFGKIWSASIDSRSYTQPIVAMAETVVGSTHDVVFAGTQNDTLYAFDADTGALLWTRSFTNPPTVTVVPDSYFGNCQTFAPSIGITSTPVYDRSTHSLYVVVATLEGTSPNQAVHFRLHQISVNSGSDMQAPADITGSTTDYQGNPVVFQAQYQAQRPSLLESNGNIYIAFGSFDDLFHQYARGWIFAYSASTLQQLGFYVTVRGAPAYIGTDPTPYYMGSMWGSGVGPAADANGNVWFLTANGPADGTWNFGDSVMELPPNLSGTQLHFFTPVNYNTLDANDLDFGSAGLTLLPPQSGKYPNLVWADGKAGIGYLINAGKLGGFAPSSGGYLKNVRTRAIYGAAAFYQDSSGIPWIFTSNDTNPDYIASYKIGTAPYSITLTAIAPTPMGRLGGTIPIVSSNGSTRGTAIVWYLDRPKSTGPIPLYALDASNVAHQLYTATAGQWIINGTGALLEPAVANGKVYVASDYEITAFGLLP